MSSDIRYFCVKVSTEHTGEWEIFFLEDVCKWGTSQQGALAALATAVSGKKYPLFTTFLRDYPISRYAVSIMKAPPSEARLKRSYGKAIKFAHAVEEEIKEAEKKLDHRRDTITSTEEYALKMLSSITIESKTETVDLTI